MPAAVAYLILHINSIAMVHSFIQNTILEAGKTNKTLLVNLTDNTKNIQSDIWREMEPHYFKTQGNINILYAIDVKTNEFIGLDINQINDIMITNHIFSSDNRKEILGDLLSLMI